MPKKVFISHASEDKKRFVNGLATALIERGIDAWYDKWEIMPGDSLVDKIFGEGIGRADCIIIVLSKYSLEKDWVRKEINVSVVKQIQEKIRVIPVLIDDSQVPTALLETRYIKIPDVENYQGSLDEITMAIEGINDKPPLGRSPPFILVDVAPFPGLNKVDTIIFNRSCEFALKLNEFSISDDDLLENISDLGLSPQMVDESIDILDSESYVRASKSTGGALTNSHFNITTHGFEVYAQAWVKDYLLIKKRLYIALGGKTSFDGGSYARESGVPLLIIEHILDELEARGLLETSKGYKWVEADCISPKIKRMVAE